MRGGRWLRVPLSTQQAPQRMRARLTALVFAQHFQEGRRAQQQLENGLKQLENVRGRQGGGWDFLSSPGGLPNLACQRWGSTGSPFRPLFWLLPQSKRKFERDCREAEKAAQTAERLDQDINATKADVEKVRALCACLRVCLCCIGAWGEGVGRADWAPGWALAGRPLNHPTPHRPPVPS